MDPDQLDSKESRVTALKRPATWDCVLALTSSEDRHDVPAGVFPPDGPSLVSSLTDWINTQDRDGQAIADDVGILLAAADEPKPDSSDDAVLRAQEDDIIEDRLGLIVYLHSDGKPPGYDAYLARPDLKGDPSAQNRYYQRQMDEGGAVADRLRHYSDDISKRRADFPPE